MIRGPRLGDEIVECDQLSFKYRRVPFPVTSCSHYIDRNQANLEEMEEIALIIKAEPRRTRAGFVHKSQSSDERDALTDE